MKSIHGIVRGNTGRDHGRLWRASRNVIEAVERRLLFSTNISGAITASTTWTTAGSPYILIAATYVRQGSNLTIQPGVVVQTSNSSQLYVSDDSTAASVNASGATFNAQLVTNTSAQGSITGSAFNTQPIFNSTSPGSITLVGNTFGGGVAVNAQYVPTLVGNTFPANSTIAVLGGSIVTSNTTWPALTNVSQYEIVAYSGSYNGRGVHVQSGATLTISAGVKLTTDGSNYNSNYEGLYVSDDSSGARLIANGSTGAIIVTAPLFLDATASATITNDQINGSYYSSTPGVGGIVVTGTSFAQNPTFDNASVAGYILTGDTFSQSASIRPQMVPLINGDSFAPGSTLGILGGGLITSSVTWSVIPNVSQYEIVADSGSYNGRGVHVQSGATLTIAAGVKLTTDGSNYNSNYEGLYISDDSSGATLIANGSSAVITITAPVYFDGTTTAAVVNCQFGGSVYSATPGVGGISITGTSFAQTPTFDAASVSGYTLTTDTFSQSVSIGPQILPLINSDTFAPNSTIAVLGGGLITSTVTWGVIPNVSQYEIVAYGGAYNGRGVHVQSGSTLTLSPGVKVTTDGSNYNSNYEGIYVSDDSSGAKLVANGSGGMITVVAPMFFDGTAGAAVVNCQLGGSLYAATPGTAGIMITGTSFTQTATFDAASWQPASPRWGHRGRPGGCSRRAAHRRRRSWGRSQSPGTTDRLHC